MDENGNGIDEMFLDGRQQVFPWMDLGIGIDTVICRVAHLWEAWCAG